MPARQRRSSSSALELRKKIKTPGKTEDPGETAWCLRKQQSRAIAATPWVSGRARLPQRALVAVLRCCLRWLHLASFPVVRGGKVTKRCAHSVVSSFAGQHSKRPALGFPPPNRCLSWCCSYSSGLCRLGLACRHYAPSAVCGSVRFVFFLSLEKDFRCSAGPREQSLLVNVDGVAHGVMT